MTTVFTIYGDDPFAVPAVAPGNAILTVLEAIAQGIQFDVDDAWHDQWMDGGDEAECLMAQASLHYTLMGEMAMEGLTGAPEAFAIRVCTPRQRRAYLAYASVR